MPNENGLKTKLNDYVVTANIYLCDRTCCKLHITVLSCPRNTQVWHEKQVFFLPQGKVTVLTVVWILIN